MDKKELQNVFVMRLGERNKNGRLYTEQAVRPAIDSFMRRVKIRTAVGTLGFPSIPPGSDPDYAVMQVMTVSQEDASHLISNVRIDDQGQVLVDVQVLDTPKGQQLRRLLDQGASVDFRTRGFADVDNDNVVRSFNLVSIDAVSNGA